ncbi:hypothetical protein ABIB35_001293 [Arthrobacter sp. UYP6]
MPPRAPIRINMPASLAHWTTAPVLTRNSRAVSFAETPCRSIEYAMLRSFHDTAMTTSERRCCAGSLKPPRLFEPDRGLLHGFPDESVPSCLCSAQRDWAPWAGRHCGPQRPKISISFHAFVRTLEGNKLKGSMGRVGACADNAALESFFSLLQKNVLDRQRWSTRADLRLATVTWIEETYHRKRRQWRLGRLTPVEFETIIYGLKAA